MSDKSRRKLLKSIAAGSGAIVAGKSLPESWSRPVIDSVMLPAHAQTSQLPDPIACTPDPQSVTFTGDDENPDEIYLVFDGVSTCQLLTSPLSGGQPADSMIQFDADFDLANWDYYSNGANWPTYPDSWSGPSPMPNNTGENDLSPGTYIIEVTHANSSRFRVTFTVSISPSTPSTGRTMTVSGVSIVPIS